MIYSNYEFFTLKNISLHLLNLGAPPVSQEGEERNIDWIIQINIMYWYKLWIFHFIKVSLHLFNLGAPPVSQKGEERKIDWIRDPN